MPASVASRRLPWGAELGCLIEPLPSPPVPANAVLLLSCADHPGIVADVAQWVTSSGGNIIHAEQHTDREDGMFFQRVEFTTDSLTFDVAELDQHFAGVAARHGMSADIRLSGWRPRTVVLASKPPHCLADLLARAYTGDLDLDIAAVVSNHRDNEGLATIFGTPFHHLPVGDDRGGQEQRLADLLAELQPELIVLARYMLVLPAWIVDSWPQSIINIHHSFLPAFVGASPYRQAHDRGVKVIGATAHYVTAGLDEGPIIDQDVTRVSHRDDVSELTRKGRDLEVAVLARAVRAHIEHRVLTWGNRTVIFE
jgi:formyltetrahydrofolate deformylase